MMCFAGGGKKKGDLGGAEITKNGGGEDSEYSGKPGEGGKGSLWRSVGKKRG